MRSTVMTVIAASLTACMSPSEMPSAQPEVRRTLTFGIALGSIEEGTRILSVARLLPFEHPDALNHDFPNPQIFSRAEVKCLIGLGRHAGLQLWATLTRYPSPPGDWPYAEFAPPDPGLFEDAPVVTVPATACEIAGPRVVAFVDREPAVFIVDTRGMTLAERGMTRATAMGLDIDRETFLAALRGLAVHAPASGAGIVVVERSREGR